MRRWRVRRRRVRRRRGKSRRGRGEVEEWSTCIMQGKCNCHSYHEHRYTCIYIVLAATVYVIYTQW